MMLVCGKMPSGIVLRSLFLALACLSSYSVAAYMEVVLANLLLCALHISLSWVSCFLVAVCVVYQTQHV